MLAPYRRTRQGAPILVVHDEADTREMLRRLLERDLLARIRQHVAQGRS